MEEIRLELQEVGISVIMIGVSGKYSNVPMKIYACHIKHTIVVIAASLHLSAYLQVVKQWQNKYKSVT